MTTALAIFVKTPGLSPVKTRLAREVGQKRAMAFYLSCLKAMSALGKEVAHRSRGWIVPYWAVAESAGKNYGLWRDFDCLVQPGGGLGERLSAVYDRLLTEHDRVILIGADCPQLTADTILSAISLVNTHQFVIGPTEDGGFYLFGGALPIPRNLWTGVSYSTATTRRDLARLLRRLAPVKLLPCEFDVDHAADLERLVRGTAGRF